MMNGTAIRVCVTCDAILFVRCGGQCELLYFWTQIGRDESLPNFKVTSATRVHPRGLLHLLKMRWFCLSSLRALDNVPTTRVHMWRQLQQFKNRRLSLPSLLALDNQLLASVKVHS